MNTELEIKSLGNEQLCGLKQNRCTLPRVEIAKIAKGRLGPLMRNSR